MDVGVFVELEQVGVAEFTHMGTVEHDPLQTHDFRKNELMGFSTDPCGKYVIDRKLMPTSLLKSRINS